jgi:hypothetical protein
LNPFEALYGRRCRTPMRWDNPVHIIVLRWKILKEMELKIAKISII